MSLKYEPASEPLHISPLNPKLIHQERVGFPCELFQPITHEHLLGGMPLVPPPPHTSNLLLLLYYC